jgi:hypothetical protein
MELSRSVEVVTAAQGLATATEPDSEKTRLIQSTRHNGVPILAPVILTTPVVSDFREVENRGLEKQIERHVYAFNESGDSLNESMTNVSKVRATRIVRVAPACKTVEPTATTAASAAADHFSLLSLTRVQEESEYDPSALGLNGDRFEDEPVPLNLSESVVSGGLLSRKHGAENCNSSIISTSSVNNSSRVSVASTSYTSSVEELARVNPKFRYPHAATMHEESLSTIYPLQQNKGIALGGNSPQVIRCLLRCF